jgi:serine/threonine protein kinase
MLSGWFVVLGQEFRRQGYDQGPPVGPFLLQLNGEGPTIEQLPHRFGDYLLLERVSFGGMAEVFRARAFGLGGFQKTFALKRILPEVSRDPEFVTMFIDEAKLASTLEHGNICHIYEFGRVDEFFFQLMEFIPGLDLRRLTRTLDGQGLTVPVALSLSVIAQASAGLGYAHRKTDSWGTPLNIVHRDVSPQNIMLSFDGAVKVIDFGIAKAKRRISRTQPGVIKGKTCYVPPELLRGDILDGRGDIFSLGVVLFELLTKRRLFQRDNDFLTFQAILEAEIPRPSALNVAIPTSVDEVVLRCLARDPDKRFATGEELQGELERCAAEHGMTVQASQLRAFMMGRFAIDVAKEQQKQAQFSTLDELGQLELPPSRTTSVIYQSPLAPARTVNPGADGESDEAVTNAKPVSEELLARLRTSAGSGSADESVPTIPRQQGGATPFDAVTTVHYSPSRPQSDQSAFGASSQRVPDFEYDDAAPTPMDETVRSADIPFRHAQWQSGTPRHLPETDDDPYPEEQTTTNVAVESPPTVQAPIDVGGHMKPSPVHPRATPQESSDWLVASDGSVLEDDESAMEQLDEFAAYDEFEESTVADAKPGQQDEDAPTNEFEDEPTDYDRDYQAQCQTDTEPPSRNPSVLPGAPRGSGSG